MLVARNIWKSYNEVEVLKGVDLDIETGSITSIIGKSGAGKSTLLHILGTLDQADKGTLEIDGIELSKFSEKKLAGFRNRKIGFVFQFHHLIPEFTALENVCIPAYISQSDPKESNERAKNILNLVGLSHRMHHKPSQLSGGEQQRVAIARALINNPSIVFADEPTGNLDNHTSQDLHKLFVDLRKDLNVTLIIVTHNNELAALSDRCIEITDGRVK